MYYVLRNILIKCYIVSVKKNKTNDKVNPTELMTGYEIRTYRGYKKTAADQLKDQQMFSAAVKQRLAMTEQVKSAETGEMINVTALELLVDAKFQADLDNPEGIDLVKWRKAAGEEVVQSEVKVNGASELFGDIAIKETK